MEILRIQLIICLLPAFTSVCFAIPSCYNPTCGDSIQVKCIGLTAGASSTAPKCNFYNWALPSTEPVGSTQTVTRQQYDGSYQVNCTGTLKVKDLPQNDMHYYLYARVTSVRVNMTKPVYFGSLSLQDQSDYNKTYGSFLNAATKSISVRIVGCPAPNKYELAMKNKTDVNETAWVIVPTNQYEFESSKPILGGDMDVHVVTLRFVDDRAIQATQYVLEMGNGISPNLLFPFSLDESFTDDFPVLAVALGVAGAVVAILIIGGVAYYVYRNYFVEE